MNTDNLNATLTLLLEPIKAKLLQLGIDDFYIGGGFVRDLLLGSTPKDIDIFVSGNNCGQYQNADCEEYVDQDVLTVDKHHINETDLALEIIILGPAVEFSPQGVIDRFDINLCKVVVDQEGTLTADEGFIADMTNKTITPVQLNGDGNSRLIKRINRLKGKYPDHALNDPYDLTLSLDGIMTVLDD